MKVLCSRQFLDIERSRKRERTEYISLPLEIVWKIFTFLDISSLNNARRVCREWKVFCEEKIENKINSFIFGKTKWEKHFGDVGKEPLLPSNLVQLLSRSCIFWPQKKVFETHILTLIPQTVNGEPLTLDSLKKIIQKPKMGHPSKYSVYNKTLKRRRNRIGPNRISHWVLMTRDVVPRSQNRSYYDQKELMRTYAERSGLSYDLPTALDAAVSIFMEHVQSGTRLYCAIPFTEMRCKDWMHFSQSPMILGGFNSDGLVVESQNREDNSFLGIAGVISLSKV